MAPYALYLHERIYNRLPALPRRDRNAFMQFLRHLAQNPFQPHDYVEYVDVTPVSVKIFERLAILYYVDHAVREIKITDVRKADGA